MRKLILAFTTVLVTGCSPFQVLWNVQQQAGIQQETDPEKKEVLQNNYDAAVAAYQSLHDAGIADRPCPEYFDMAIAAGFSVEQWREPLARIMYRESNCNPMADNSSSTARGLLQELEMWADDCGGTYEDLHDPWFNITCGYHIYQVQGWNAWSTY